MRRAIRVRGLVQGVGFRPHVHGLARRHRLTGWVLNDGDGVAIEVEGPAGALAGFEQALAAEAPPLARVDSVSATAARPRGDETGFEIRASARSGPVATGVIPDAAVCDACLAELFDPADRRYRYPFLNCTHCGPRYTITRGLPYDRTRTAMAGFALCPTCAAEYHDPADRRFHAQPTACPACGPRLTMPVGDVMRRIGRGEIVAIKGLGGFHLACDARDAATVARLRRVKQRDGKPFAVMVANLVSARGLADITALEAATLTAPARPIVLVRRRDDGEAAATLAPAVAPDLAWLGVLLPYTPLHYLLFHEAAGRPAGTDWLEAPQPLALVMTSANPGGEPLAIDTEEAVRRLAGIADAICGHDRPILVRVDDSVVRVIDGAPVPIRRARGAVPATITLARPVAPVLAVGGQLKTTVCLTRGDQAVVSQHIGGLDDLATVGFFRETVDHLKTILEVTPVAVGHDLHPDFASTRLALGLGLPTVAVQHHHAHIAAVAAEHRIEGPLGGLALDGVGLGSDGAAWGGELLAVDGPRFERLGHLAPLALPGGDVAARQPWRMAAAVLHRAGLGHEIAARFADRPGAAVVAEMLTGGVRTPPTTALGRWFDAACGMLGVRPVAGYEGEAPIVLESLVTRPTVLADGWTEDADGALDLTPVVLALRQVNAATGADLFHGTLVAALVAWAAPRLAAAGLERVAHAGGCLANRWLAEGLAQGLRAAGFEVLLARLVPPNDGGLALGQAWVTALSVARATAVP